MRRKHKHAVPYPRGRNRKMEQEGITMARYKIKVVETRVREVEVSDASEDEIEKMLTDMYNNGEIKLTDDDFSGVEFVEWEQVLPEHEYHGEYE